MKYRKAVFVIAYVRNKKEVEYLVLKRKLHWVGWEFPKGGVEFFETKRQAVKREIKEETGLSVLKIKRFCVKGKYRYDKEYPERKRYVGQSYVLYAVEVRKKKVKIDKLEHSDYKWLDFRQAMKKITWPNQRKCLKIVNGWIEKV